MFGRFDRSFTAFAALSCAVACGPAAPARQRPTPALSTGLAAQERFRSIVRRWGREERARLAPDLSAFLRDFPTDGRSTQVRVMLGWLLAEQGRTVEARRLIAPARAGAPGSTRDLADVVQAVVLLREGRASEALELVEPLAGKLVDRGELLLANELRTRAAIGARSWWRATDAMLEWVELAPATEKEGVEQALLRLIGELPQLTQEQALRRLDQEVESGTVTAERQWLRAQLLERLITAALTGPDAALASRLLQLGSARRGERGRALLKLAAQAEHESRVAGRSVGVVLSLGTEAQRARSAQVIRGAARAVGLERKDGVRVVYRTESGEPAGVERALRGLANDGASVLIAAVDGRAADRAASFAEGAEIPVLLLHPPDSEEPRKWAFVVGVETDVDTLEEALEELGHADFEIVGGSEIPCSVTASVPWKPRFPVELWRRERVTAILLAGDATCSRDVVDELRAAGLRPTLALGLRSLELYAEPIGLPMLALGAGRLPETAAGRTARSWVEAVAEDAVTLAAATLAAFPDTLIDAAQTERLRARYAALREQLRVVKTPLLTTERSGFEGELTLERALVVSNSEDNP